MTSTSTFDHIGKSKNKRSEAKRTTGLVCSIQVRSTPVPACDYKLYSTRSTIVLLQDPATSLQQGVQLLGSIGYSKRSPTTDFSFKQASRIDWLERMNPIDVKVWRVLLLGFVGSLLPRCSAYNPFPIAAPRSVGRSVKIAPYGSLRRTRSVRSSGRFVLRAELEASATTAAELEGSRHSFGRFLHIVWRFTRPHTLVGSALAIPAIHAFAAPSFASLLTMSTLASMTYAMLPALLMNLYITGLNQITDVEIDKVNKPDLPIAAGDLQIRDAVCIVLVALLLSLWIGVAHPVYGSQGLNLALWGSGILGTMYSLPPFRLKRFPLLAAFCIVAVRGTVINAGFFAHAKRAAFGGQIGSVVHYLANDRACMLSSVFFGVFGIVVSNFSVLEQLQAIRADKLP